MVSTLDNNDVFYTARAVFSVYSLIVTILGTLLNIFSFYICLRVKKNTTFIFLRFFAIFNIFALYWWNLNHFLSVFVDLDLLSAGLWVCKIGNFVQFTSLQLAAWFLVLISADRVLGVYLKHWKTIYFKPRRAIIASIGTTILLLGTNSNILFTFGYEAWDNGTHYNFCFEVPGFPSTTW
jgi:hypothetical protein